MYSFLLFLYFPVFLKCLFCLCRIRNATLSNVIGRLEFLLLFLRDSLLSWLLFGLALYGFYKGQSFLNSFLFLFCFILSGINRSVLLGNRLALCGWVLKEDVNHPEEFFKIYYQSLGSYLNQIPTQVDQVSFSHLSYLKNEAPKKSILVLIWGFFNTATLARLALLAMKNFQLEEGVACFDAFARIWGARFVWLAQMDLKTIFPQHFNFELSGKILILFNHKSYFDFALNFFAMGAIRNGNRHLKPRFIAAKDHFIDNPLFYSFLGIGKCIEKAGMIFINREKGKGWRAIEEASRQLLEKDVEVAVYPQGTRAPAIAHSEGDRADAGYYTTSHIKTLTQNYPHLKKGVAQLILDTALSLKENGQDPLKILFVGIVGSATAGPKASFQIQKNCKIEFRVQPVWEFRLPSGIELEKTLGKYNNLSEAHQNYEAFINEIENQINRRLALSSGVHKHLKNLYLSEKFLKTDKAVLEKLENFLNEEEKREHWLCFAILDLIYAQPLVKREKLLTFLSGLICEGGDKVKMKKLYDQLLSMGSKN